MDKRGYDFSQSLEKKMFNFGPRNPEALSVDASLAGLFDCLTMECRYATVCTFVLRGGRKFTA